MRHRLTESILNDDNGRWIDIYGNLHHGGKQISYNNNYNVRLNLGELWEPEDEDE